MEQITNINEICSFFLSTRKLCVYLHEFNNIIILLWQAEHHLILVLEKVPD